MKVKKADDIIGKNEKKYIQYVKILFKALSKQIIIGIDFFKIILQKKFQLRENKIHLLIYRKFMANPLL